MSAPLKPWETPGTNARASSLSSSYQSPLRSSIPGSSGGFVRNSLQSSVPSSSTSGTAETRNPPQIPARPQRSNYSNYGYSGMSGYGSMMGYGGYGGGMYGLSSYGYGGLGSYGGYGGGYGAGYGMNRYGMGYNRGSSFTQRAEESSRAAFQSIESIVQAFGSIAMMLESTHFAVMNSFRAVLGVADHFSRLRGHLMSVLGTIAIFRFIKNLYYKLLVLLRLRERTVIDDVWSEAKNAMQASSEVKKSQRSWPIVMFFGVVLGAPWLFWKLLQSLCGDDEKAKEWMTGEGDHVLARAEYDFEAENDEELAFHSGDMLRLAPKDKQPHVKGWLLASLNGTSEGLVPANYIKILGLKKGKKLQAESNTAAAPNHSTASHLDTDSTQTHVCETVQHRSPSAQQDTTDVLPTQNLEVGAVSDNDDLHESGLLDNEFIALNQQEEQR